MLQGASKKSERMKVATNGSGYIVRLRCKAAVNEILAHAPVSNTL